MSLDTSMPPRRRRQRGFSLPTVLIFLIVLIMLSLTAVRTVVNQEKIVTNTQDWNLAFQAAESALRDGETDILSSGRIQGNTAFDKACTNGLCLPKEDGGSVWKDLAADDEGWQGSADSGPSVKYATWTGAKPAELPDVLVQPRYVIEALGIRIGSLKLGSESSYAYRVTAVGFGRIKNEKGDPAVKVVLQSIFYR